MPPKEKYTDPKLRDEVKEEIHNSDKGGAPGQWSARKAQMMASEYKKRGGDYNTDKSEKDESQKNLDNWGKEDWQTKEGDGKAKQDDGSEKRYLPKKAWENMSEEEKKKTDEKKQAESKKGKQHVENTEKAKDSRKKASEDNENNGEQHDSPQDEDDADGEYQPDGEEDDENDENDENAEPSGEQDEQKDQDVKAGQKRSRGKENSSPAKKQKSNAGKANDKKSSSKDDEAVDDDEADDDDQAEDDSRDDNNAEDGSKADKKTIGSKHMDAEEPAKKGSADRLPKKDQKVQWKAMPGYVAGKLVEVMKADKKIDGKSHKASATEPKLVLKSDSSGKICVHKPETCFYD
ncbi:hypothetical protein AMS68_002419 [Peltaster fructicola]|uniref:Hypervirulence associated protein TUDOR domain-containing protein n=1 Tax=Peltaster fructicola TaxID=286661 RepID=A0A6H0XQ58_9PEZI|nr:hypothetical protein AMS68_002419 [Peltaster fructicola]